MKNSWNFFYCLILVAFLFPILLSAQDKPERVLVLHSYHKAAWTDNIMEGIDSVLSKRRNLKMYIEYMDTKEFNDPEYLKMLHDTILMKYKNLEFDLIITSDDNAWQFAMEHNDDLFNYAPIVFCGVNRFKPELIIKGRRVSGVVEKGDFKPTLDYIVEAMPRLEHLYIICDNTKTGRINMANMAKVMKESFPGIKYTCFRDKTYEKMGETLRTATPGTNAAFFIAFWKDSEGRAVSPSDLERVFRESTIPIFGRSEWMIDRGMAGGKCVSGFNQGMVAAQLGVKILDDPEKKVPPVIMDSPNQFMFDYIEMKKHRLLGAPLPEGSKLFNRPYSFSELYEEHAVFFWILGFLLILLVTALNILIIDKIKCSHVEKALRQSEKNLSITLESIGDAVIATDSEGKVVNMNRVAASLTGWKAEDAFGVELKEVFKIINSGTGEKAEDPVSKVIREGDIVGLANDTVLISKDDTRRQIADSGAPIRDDNGEIVGVVLVFRDVTEEYKIQAQLRQSQKMQAIGQLAGGVAHDFNNLLTAIVGNAQLLGMSEQPTPESFEFVSDILKASKRATDLTSQLLAFSRQDPLQNKTFSVHDIIEEVIGILSHSIDKRITIQREFESDSDTLVGDPSQVQNAFLNLAVNARDAMPEGGILEFTTRKVYLKESKHWDVPENFRSGDYIEITVTDSGCGMQKVVLERIFEPFYSTKPEGEGTGLGLASVYGSIISHGGNIKVSSQVNRGTTFTVLLPLDKGAGSAADLKKGETVTGTGNILVIDDEIIVLNLCKKAFSKLGYKVVVCEDGQDGVDYYRKNIKKVDLIILDLMMPNLSGQDTFNLLKEINPEVKVIILSGFSKDKVVSKMINNGALGFIKKPFEISMISQEIAKCILHSGQTVSSEQW